MNKLEPEQVLKMYLEGAVTFSELILALSDYHRSKEMSAVCAEKPFCANCGRDFPWKQID